MGVRSSWLASSMNIRSLATARSMRSSMALMVRARCSISSLLSGTGRRRPSSLTEISSASPVRRRTGRRAAPASNQPEPASRPISSGPGHDQHQLQALAGAVVVADG